MEAPNQEQIASFVRTLLQTIGTGFGVTWLQDGNTVLAISSFIGVLAVTIWGLWARRNTALVQSAAGVPSTAQIVTTDRDIAANTPGNVVLPNQA